MNQTPNATGDFTFFVRDSNAISMCVDTAKIVVTVNAQPAITGRDTAICLGESVDLSTLINGTAQNALEYGTSFGTYGGSMNQTPNAMGDFTFFVRDSNTMSMCVDTAKIVVTVNAQPAIRGRDTTICSGESCLLYTSPSPRDS